MPATRSRTENWRQTLQGIFDKGGALEITPARYGDMSDPEHDPSAAENPNLIWRVRILSLTDEYVVIEQPTALGHPVKLNEGVELVGLIAIGQNRWMFKTRILGPTAGSLGGGRSIPGYKLAAPESVERCQRRNFYRISTVGLVLPEVEIFELIDPASAVIAETASKCNILDLQESMIAACKPRANQCVMPEVGPSARGTLVNIGGGGVGILFDAKEALAFDTNKLYWLQIGLSPHIPAPLAVSGRVRHTHIDSAQRIYAGIAFEFGHNPGHEKFIVDQLLRYVAQIQREQLKRTSA